MKNKILILVSLIILATNVNLKAQTANISSLNANDSKLSLDDIYVTYKYRTKYLRTPAWMKDNKSYTAIETNKEIGGTDIVKYDIRTGKRTILVSAKLLIPKINLDASSDATKCTTTDLRVASEGKPLRIRSFYWSKDNTKLLIYTNTKRVWRSDTRGDYWVLDMNTKDLYQIGEDLDESRLMYAKFNNQGNKIAFVYYNNIYVEDLATKKIKALTKDGNNFIVNGNFDWVYEEELHLYDGFRWSPDGKTIAYWQSNTEGTGVFKIINNVDSIYSTVKNFPYPKVGTTNSSVRMGAVNVETADTKWFDIPGDPRNNYLARMDFIPNSNEIMVQQLNRLQNTNRVWICDVNTMKINNIITYKDKAFVNCCDNIEWLNNYNAFTWTSEKDGWRHLYKVSRDGKSEELITKGDFDVISIKCIDVKGGWVYYIASPHNACEKYLYKSRLNGKGKAERVTPNNFKGQNNYELTSNAKYAFHEWNNSTNPNFYEMINLPKHKTIRVLEDNKKVKEEVANIGLNNKEWFKVDLGYVSLDAWMIKPLNFDPNKKYPVIFYIYGEPWSSTVQNCWSGGDFWNKFLSEQGYIVMSVDPRGTNNPKGREWRKSIYGKLGDVPPADHAKAVLEIEKMYSYIDATRIGIWGWSGGGSSTAHAMFKYPNIYSAGISVAGVYLQKLYDTIYQERYMGLPSTNAEGYRIGSPINFVKGLKGKYMIVHGTGDDNVHYQGCEMLINELIKEGKFFDLMIYPMRTHGIREGRGTTLHLYSRMTKFWLENLPNDAR